MAESHLQVNHDGSLETRKTVLWGASEAEKKEVLLHIFSQPNWHIDKLEHIEGSYWKVVTSSQNITYKINLYVSSVRDEARQPDEYKMQLGAISPIVEEDWITLIMGIYTISHGPVPNEYILSAYNKDRFTFSTNPSIRGTRTSGLQKAKILGMYKTDISYLFRPEFIYYYIENQEKLNSSPNQTITNSTVAPQSVQVIYYGAPGTGKSYEIKKNVGTHKSFRITFHPDTDYSSFVGAYKPTSVEVPMLTTLGEKAIPVKDMEGNPLTENKIIYTYVKQAFLNAYIEAWKEQEKETPQPVYLVIEEINRGNCAQIFGDIFQLLDRNSNGFSDYAIVPDTDLSRHVKKDLEKLVIANKEAINAIYEECEEDMVGKVVKGEVLLLPNNLYIWATMNTSDQSLFPIDSAFKRRWDWKYIKIADAHKNWQIKIGAKAYDWWQFVQAINYFVFDATQSEDKNLGYFFAKAKDGVINAETFVSKVIFYLYTDVFKDYGFSGDIFKGANDEEMTFQSFYNAEGSPCEAQISRFIENVMFSDALPEALRTTVEILEESEDYTNSKRFALNGEEMTLGTIANKVVSNYANSHPELNANSIKETFVGWCKGIGVAHIVETDEEYQARSHQSSAERSRTAVTIPNGEIIHVSTQWRAKNPEDNFFKFIEICNQNNLGEITQV